MRDRAANCSRCGAPIVFLTAEPSSKNPRPKPNPINRFSEDDGNVLVDWNSGTYKVIPADERPAMAGAGAKFHKSHFATCPRADAWRKK